MATTLCIDASLAVRRVLDPGDAAVQEAWDEWEAQGPRQPGLPTRGDKNRPELTVKFKIIEALR
jgi:hypothetical protein